MTSKERVYKALRKEAVDRVPVFMWFHPETLRQLSVYFEIPQESIADIFFDDIKQIWVNNNYAMEGITHVHDGETHIDAWGITWEKRHFFNQVIEHPLIESTPKDVLAYSFPYDKLETLTRPMKEIALYGNDFFIGSDVSPCAFEMYWRLRGMERSLLDFAEYPKLAQEMIRRCVDFAVFLSKNVIKRYDLDWLWTGDDVSSQSSMILSPGMWRDFIKPELKRVFDIGKDAELYTAYHCCGTVRPIIPDLIEIGMDVLNPIQPNCPGMDPAELKREFGKDIAFMGGIDTQKLLPKGTEQEVRTEVRKLIDTMTTDGGGFILAASHTIPPETPLDNIFALYEEAGIEKESILDHAADIRNNVKPGKT